MNQENRNCQNCKQAFTIESEDFAFYETMKVPPPTFCPKCRMVRRASFRNERALYKRQCDLCKEMKVMMFPVNTPFPVYCYACWLSDGWDARTYARPYDFSKSFFQQFKDFINIVPRPGRIAQGNTVDSEYTNRVTDQRRCYLVYGSINNEDCRYSSWVNDSKEVLDSVNTLKSERCIECIDSYQCSNLSYSQECRECSHSAFLFNCRNCTNCIGCVNLRNKSYCIFNEQYSKEDYDVKVKELGLGTREGTEKIQKGVERLRSQNPVPWAMIYHSNDVTGNWIDTSKNVSTAFSCNDVENGKYLYGIARGKDLMDHWQWSAGSERIYEAVSTGIQCANLKFTNECWIQVLDSEYSMNCHSSSNLFGCIGIRNGNYMIFNQQYSEAEYRDIVTRIKEQMDAMPYQDAAGRIYKYGEFFPIELSPFPYNETVAQEYFTLTKEEALRSGYSWRDPEARNYSITMSAIDVPKSIQYVGEDFSSAIVGCVHAGICTHLCTTAFRVLPEDINMYKLLSVPLPTLCPNCRHGERLAKRNPLEIWERTCACRGNQAIDGRYTNTATHFHAEEVCPNIFKTSYPPGSTDIVYCEQCYQNEVS
jgi:hypothetical protein